MSEVIWFVDSDYVGDIPTFKEIHDKVCLDFLWMIYTLEVNVPFYGSMINDRGRVYDIDRGKQGGFVA